MCDNKVTKFIQRGYGYKEITMKCGSTGTRGEQVLCDDCEEALAKRYPQGWFDTPGDMCVHGTFVGDSGGPDYMCGMCENGD